ncbi:MAG: class A beta-lactamase-related serine hydrolase, partial [Patescibacteria group bacterium]|nr:class A beta-lactamase-related serine hydrolase [Patescibacteria group bacterium]
SLIPRLSITYRRMAELMGQQSDNTAFNIISQTLGGEKIQKVIDNLGMRETSFAENETSAGDIGLLLEKIYRGQVLNQESREEILSFLTKTIWEDRIPAGVPADIRVAHKIGTEVGVISDAGIIYGEKPFVLVIMSEGVNEIEAKKALPDITKKIWEMVE